MIKSIIILFFAVLIISNSYAEETEAPPVATTGAPTEGPIVEAVAGGTGGEAGGDGGAGPVLEGEPGDLEHGRCPKPPKPDPIEIAKNFRCPPQDTRCGCTGIKGTSTCVYKGPRKGTFIQCVQGSDGKWYGIVRALPFNTKFEKEELGLAFLQEPRLEDAGPPAPGTEGGDAPAVQGTEDAAPAPSGDEPAPPPAAVV